MGPPACAGPWCAPLQRRRSLLQTVSAPGHDAALMASCQAARRPMRIEAGCAVDGLHLHGITPPDARATPRPLACGCARADVCGGHAQALTPRRGTPRCSTLSWAPPTARLAAPTMQTWSPSLWPRRALPGRVARLVCSTASAAAGSAGLHGCLGLVLALQKRPAVHVCVHTGQHASV